MKFILLSILLLLFKQGYAQYQGSSADGQYYTIASGLRLNGVIAVTSPLYQGGRGDGVDRVMKTTLLDGGLLSLYDGGRGDGYARKAGNFTLTGYNASSLYSGGTGDGYAKHFSQSLLTGEILLIYTGGSGDGYSEDKASGLLLTGAMTMLYEGGNGDGYALSRKNELLLSGFMTMLYEGGDGDGYSMALANASTIDGIALQQFMGGDGDGYAATTLEGFIFQVLPVEWISFEAVKKESSVLLLWSTANETLNHRFQVEHASDGLAFAKIAEVPGSGTSTTRNDYSSIHRDPNTGLNYYRIRQLDIDGRSTYTDIRKVIFENEGITVNIYPNPNKTRILNIEMIGLQSTSQVDLKVIDSKGQVLLKKNINPKAIVNLSWTWPAGTYYIELQTGTQRYTRSLIILD